MPKPTVDYSLYLVTDSTPAILGDRDLSSVVAAAVRGGVTIVQYRDKTSDTGELVANARKLHAVCREAGVPLLINDRVDVALAVGCEGVHIGQDDMELTAARKILGPDAIIGVTASTIEEALKACEDGADYLGIGTVFATSTKENTKHIIGTAGLRTILTKLAAAGHLPRVKTVCIGGLNPSNIQRVLYQSANPDASSPASLDGVALVSAIVAAKDPESASRNLLELVKTSPSYRSITSSSSGSSSDASASPVDVDNLLAQIPSVITRVATTSPLSHNMTNLVVQNFAANVALAVGASPIMANYGQEAPDLARLGGSLVVNMGTVTPDGIANYLLALSAYNAARRPVVFDPVGAGATSIRRNAVKTILAGGYLDLIKGNEGEIKTVWGEGALEQQKGVDSSSTLTPAQKAKLVRDLARRERNVVLMTGKTDYLSDGQRTLAVDNGHELLGQITGTGCVLGTTVSAMLAAWADEDKLLAVLAGLLHFEIAAERAAVRADVQGPGTFVPAFIDELARVRRVTVEGDLTWLQGVKVKAVEVE
ncbi:hydroxyethylthiazole kinase [Colletotrichum abscissum]|uniref:Hydroxyethylthiazole kinase n=1 Tax=Colletotrichum abscissum TaxID=1671311 RepID=A0A9Q0B3E3_9PEZI|nr:hydroxyethylthiazole kinase [Colletotrichum abscissum]KAI3549490.1 hydroxyethylthiazole kinase [Colletotrichum abscissum]KAK1524969.1 hydroxyethylthiazole kinase [Colletotrichum abscissum]